MRLFCLFFFALVILSSKGWCQENNTNNYNFNSGQQPAPKEELQYEKVNQPNDTVPSSEVLDKNMSYAPQGDIDSLKKEILNLKKDLAWLRTDLTNVQLNLSLSHRKFKIGALLLGAGVAGFFLGSFSTASNSGYPTQLGSLLILGGLGATVTGTILMINSHKYIGKAGANVRRYNRSVRTRQ